MINKMKDKTKKWLKAAGVRAVKTVAQTAITMIGAEMVNVVSLDWKVIAGVCVTTGIISILTSITGLPEVKED